MTDSTDNVVPMPTADGGVKQQRYRRKHQQARKPPQKKRSPSDPPQAPETGGFTAVPPVAVEMENASPANDMVTSTDRLLHYDSHDVTRDHGHGEKWGRRGPVSAAPRGSGMDGLDVLAVLAALSLAGVAAWFSVHGMIVLFPGNPAAALWLGISLEGAKIITAAWLGARWADVGWLARVSLIGFTAATGVLNATGVYSQLVAAHIGPKGMTAAGLETQDAGAAAKIEAAQGRVADIDRRLALIDATVEGAARRGNARTAANAMAQQRQARAGLAQERERAMADVTSLKTERASGTAQGKAAALEAEPIQYVAQFLGVQRGGEEVIRWVIALIVGCTDPFAIALAAALAARRRRP
jgi:hypothetical protein